MHDKKAIAAIDAGGTTFKCGLFGADHALIDKTRVPTTSPDATLQACVEFFKAQSDKGYNIDALGIASFGPIDVDIASKTYGTILDTPKQGWAGTPLKSFFETALSSLTDKPEGKPASIPVLVDTDVNGALLAEMKWGAAQGARSAAYVTIGTGIGAGVFANGDVIGKPQHPEFGHIRVQRHPNDRDFDGVCSFHGDCLEGLASATALTARFGNPVDLPPDHSAWEIEAFYLAQACSALSLSFRPETIILGGGLMLAPHLIDAVRHQYAALINEYLGQTDEDIARMIVTPGLGDDAGLYGGASLALSVID